MRARRGAGGGGAAPERVVKRDLRQVGGQLLEVDVLGAAALQGGVKDLWGGGGWGGG